MDLSNFSNYIDPGLIILVPVLYIIGIAIRGASWVDNKHIPVLLGVVGILLSVCYLIATSSCASVQDVALLIFTAIVQGILVAGAAVYANQVIKQNTTDG